MGWHYSSGVCLCVGWFYGDQLLEDVTVFLTLQLCGPWVALWLLCL